LETLFQKLLSKVNFPTFFAFESKFYQILVEPFYFRETSLVKRSNMIGQSSFVCKHHGVEWTDELTNKLIELVHG